MPFYTRVVKFLSMGTLFIRYLMVISQLVICQIPSDVVIWSILKMRDQVLKFRPTLAKFHLFSIHCSFSQIKTSDSINRSKDSVLVT